MALPPVSAAAVIPNAALRREAGEVGAWQVKDGRLRFAPLKLGVTDLDGRVQVRAGLTAGDEIVLYSERALSSGSRIEVVSSLPGAER
ncbi:hypothetical protein [Thauera humireducens]|uniref:hypothetical protein n=1 Tax=Thauera humireducens TaxID=1134435 RepID=UPI00311E48E0